nr:hypothetical protein [Candidatus Sigynarchaeota archaeon]
MTTETKKVEEYPVQSRKKVTLEIAGAAIFIALSAVVSVLTTMYIPRIPNWGIAIFDPVSLVWITCFLIFGWRAGLLCTGAGTLILFGFDPTGIGPIFKFCATIPFIAIPALAHVLQSKRKSPEKDMKTWLSQRPVYAITMTCAWVARIGLMMICNYIVFVYVFPPYYLAGADLSFFGLPGVTVWSAVISMVLIINTWQSFFDVLIPYLLSFRLVPKYMKI